MAISTALAAAALLGVGFVLQQQVAQCVPIADTLSWRLLRDLIGRGRWLAGIAAMVAGQILGAVALGTATITVVEPLLTTNVLFALVLVAALSVAVIGCVLVTRSPVLLAPDPPAGSPGDRGRGPS